MSIRSWPIEERPREKLLLRGPEALSDAELLAIHLRTGYKGKSAVDLARDLLAEYGELRHLLKATQARFCQSTGLGMAKYVQLQAALELGRRHLYEILQHGDVLTSPEHTRNYLKARLRGYPHEVFACLFLDNRHRVICYEELFRGTLNSASVHPREVVKQALVYNAAAVILAHNHPSGDHEPSQADIHLTQHLKEALGLLDIRVLDHIVIGEKVTSFAERGLL